MTLTGAAKESDPGKAFQLVEHPVLGRLSFELRVGFGVWGLGFGVWGLGLGAWGLGFGVWGLEFGVWGLGFRV